MATRPIETRPIESGQIQVRGPGGGVPMVQAQLAPVRPIEYEVSAQYQSQMGSLIQRMSENLFQQAGKLAEEEGIRYAAENPPTLDEIELAKNGMVTRPTGRIFDDAFRKARSLQLATHFEVEGTNEMMKLLPDIEAGRITSDQVANKLREMNAGFTSALSKIDPQAGIKFNATMATSGNVILRKALETEIRNVKEQNRIKFDAYADKITALLQPTIEANPEQFADYIAMYTANIERTALVLGDAGLQRMASDKWRTDVRNAQIAVLTKELTTPESISDPMGTLKKIQTGQIGRLSPVLQRMIATDFESVAKVQANFLQAVAQRQTLRDQEDKQSDRLAVATVVPMYTQALAMSNDDPRKARLIEQISTISQARPGAIPWSLITTLVKPPDEDNEQAEFNMRVQIANGDITRPDQIWSQVGKGGISDKQALKVLSFMFSEDRREQVAEQALISRLAGVPQVPGQLVVLDPKSEEWKRRQQIAKDAEEIKSAAATEGRKLPISELESLLNDRLNSRRNIELLNSARKQLETYETKAGGKITNDSLTALEKSGKLNPNEMVRVRQLLRQIKEALGD